MYSFDLKKGNGGKTTSHMIDRTAQLEKESRKELAIKESLHTVAGMSKIAASLSNPVRKKLDYQGISRKFVITELWPDGMPMIFDRDIEEFSAVSVAKNGSTRYLEIEVERVTIEPFELTVNPRIPFKELYSRLYQIVKRVKERIEQSISLKEDLLYYATLDSASQLFHPVITVASYLTKDALAKSLTPLEANRLTPENILMTAYGIQSIRRWQYQDLDDTARAEVRQTGYLGSIWGTNIFVSDQLANGTYYVISSPEFHAWMPFRKEVEIMPADIPSDLVIGFVAYEFYGLTIHNVQSCVKGQFASNL